MKSRRNGSVETETECCDIGLGLMMETHHQSFPCKKMNQMVMVMPHHEPQFCSGGFDGETASSNSTPLFYNTSNNSNPGITNIYNAASSDFGSVVVPKNLQQPYYSDSLSFSSSVGGMVNVNVRIPFTPAQREELETQTVIYKYIMACLPVPQQLILSITNNLSPNGARDSSKTRGVRDMLVGFSRSLDPEPWRCKRTDGKKWRCSRDIAPDQKYCERHCHKRRSRKRVESIPNLLNNKNANMLNPKPSSFKNNNQTPFSSSMVTPAAASHGQPRALDWFVNGESASVAVSNQEWEQLMPFKLGLKSHTSKRDTDVDFPKQQNESSLNLCRGGSQGLQSQRSHDYLGGALNSNQAQQTRHFIDAWSTERDGNGIDELGQRKRGSVALNQKLPLSSLTLSMSGENSEANEENGNREMGVGVFGSERQNVTWMSPLSWMSSTPGGPLAEALCLGIASSTRATTTSNGCRSSNADVRQEFDLIN
ncbi:growth-regulating factor 8-like isoform X1 [Rosa rugosa]|uniref:growth-regulating factor 8-like isoform X1 n=1 Tax=Rosa rugosa TaxID=74645 RepID=UPI002B402535|nr:growth-regulating factor 8-like isoform X1 [Rosa rugosa]